MLYFNSYPVTPNMGLRESINAMLEHVAYNKRDFGYLPSTVHMANHSDLLHDYGDIVRDYNGVLVLVDHVNDSAFLAYLVDTLETLCNDYPVYNDETLHAIEYGLLLDMINDTREDTDPPADDIAWAITELGLYVEYSEYGANVSKDDYSDAIELAHQNIAKGIK